MIKKFIGGNKIGILACTFIFLWGFNSNIDLASAKSYKLGSVSGKNAHKDFPFAKRHQKGLVDEKQLECGATIGPNEKVQLTSDLEACISDPVLTIIGPASLNLKGHTVSGDGSNDGILIKGKGARVINGTVTNFYRGLVISGEGQHQISHMTATNNNDVGFHVESDYNRLIGNISNRNWEGFVVEGNKNRFIENKAISNDREGFEIRGNNNKLFSNKSDANKSDSIEIYGKMNMLVNNTASNDDDDGFVVKGDENWLINNRAIGNAEDGFDVSGNRNTFKTNSSKDNLESGFTFDYNTTGNKIFRNEALSNGKIDIEAENDADCENNLWKNNRFETSNPACIK